MDIPAEVEDLSFTSSRIGLTSPAHAKDSAKPFLDLEPPLTPPLYYSEDTTGVLSEPRSVYPLFLIKSPSPSCQQS
jgi:hypothetical protein